MTPQVIVPRRLAALASVPQVLPYQGSKRRLAHAIVALLPSDTAALLEPFAGSAAVAVAARHAGVVEQAHLRDLNAPLIALWQRILAEPEQLATAYERLWERQVSDPRTFYDQVRARFNETRDPALLLYLLARCVKAAVRYNRLGEFNQGPDNRRLGAKPATMRSRLLRTSGTLRGAVVSPGDYADLLLSAGARDVAYLDPPYQGVSSARDNRYVRGLDRTGFLAVLAAAVTSGVSFLLSYDGATGAKVYGEPIPADLGLLHLHLDAGRSAQATLNGRQLATVESLYVSPALVARLGGQRDTIARLTTR